jgi:cyclophilin family peptidyl-prolyl cis-trans isomerase
MASRLFIALAIYLGIASSANSQVVRFETSMGDFDMVLNPTNRPVLQAHVDNLLNYVERDAYRGSWINRADEGFVLQMGGFYTHTFLPPDTIDGTRPIGPLTPVPGEPAVETGLSNTVGTVAMALPGLPTGGTNQNGGTSSFFVNLASNTGLNTDFTVFAAIPDMTVVNQIMALMQIDRTMEPDFGAGPGNLGFTDVPIMSNGEQVLINRAFVVSDPMTIAQATASVQSVVASSTAAFANSAGGGASAARVSSAVVPEPAAISLALVGLMALGARRRQRN